MRSGLPSLHFHPLRVQHLRPVAADAIEVGFAVAEALAAEFKHTAGQYLTLRHGELRRSYSICTAPGHGLKVGVRKVQGGVFSTWLHGHLKVGDEVQALPPQGHFGAALASATAQPQRVLLVAGGSGITPILAIAQAVLEGDATARVTLVYANRDLASTMFREALDGLKNRHLQRLAVHHVFSREEVGSALAQGRIDGTKLRTFVRLAGSVEQAYVCGPHAFNDEVQAQLLAAGLPAQDVHIERFGAPPDPALVARQRAAEAQVASGTRIRITRDGLTREVAWQPGDHSVLDAATRSGLELPYSCKSGVCATCRAKCVEGEVTMARNFALEPSDVAAGFVLTCQAVPRTQRVAVDFDQR